MLLIQRNEFDLPAALVECGDRDRRAREVVGDESLIPPGAPLRMRRMDASAAVPLLASDGDLMSRDATDVALRF